MHAVVVWRCSVESKPECSENTRFLFVTREWHYTAMTMHFCILCPAKNEEHDE